MKPRCTYESQTTRSVFFRILGLKSLVAAIGKFGDHQKCVQNCSKVAPFFLLSLLNYLCNPPSINCAYKVQTGVMGGIMGLSPAAVG